MTDDINRTPADRKSLRFLRWNGDDPAPQFTHWTNRGTLIIRAATPNVSVGVYFRDDSGERFLGHDDILPFVAARHLREGKFNRELGFQAEDIVPQTLEEWNDLGG